MIFTDCGIQYSPASNYQMYQPSSFDLLSMKDQLHTRNKLFGKLVISNLYSHLSMNKLSPAIFYSNTYYAQSISLYIYISYFILLSALGSSTRCPNPISKEKEAVAAHVPQLIGGKASIHGQFCPECKSPSSFLSAFFCPFIFPPIILKVADCF